MHVLVTGGCGFIGSHIVEYHLKKGDKVHAVDDLSTGSLDNIKEFEHNENLKFEEADILTWDKVDSAMGWADRVYHLAAVVGIYRVVEEPIKVLATNIPGTERLLRAAAKSGWKPRIIMASSSEVYGQSDKDAFEETDNIIVESAAHQRWNYAISKIADEAFGLSYSSHHGIPITMIRFFNTVGPRQSGRYGMVVPRFVAQAVRNEPITVFGDGTQTRCFCDVRDTVKALDLLSDSASSVGECVNVGLDHEVSMNQLAETVKTLANSDSEISHIPYEEAYGDSFLDIRRRKPDLTKFYNLTGFKHQYNLERTINDLIAKEKTKVIVKEKSKV
jgi:UDP-glucose 4-epimerase